MKFSFSCSFMLILVVLMGGSESLFASSVSERWEIKSIDSATSISNDDISATFKPSSDEAYVCYYDKDNKKIILASQSSSGVWSHFPIPNQNDTDKKYCSIYYNQSVDRLNVSYYELGAYLITLAQRNTFGLGYLWENKIVDINLSKGDPDGAFLFYDKQAKPIIVYSIKSYSNNRTYFYFNHNQTNSLFWEENGIGIKFSTSYPIESHVDDTYSGFIAYKDKDNGDIIARNITEPHDGPLHYKFDNGTSPSLAFDRYDDPHIAYYDASTYELTYGYYNESSKNNCGMQNGWLMFSCMKVDNAGTITNLALAIDRKGYPIIAYQDASDNQSPETLNVARPIQAYGLSEGNCGPKLNSRFQWQCDVIDDATGNGGGGHLHEGDHISIAVSDNGMIMIAYTEYDDYYDTVSLKSAQLKDPSLALPAIYYLLQ